MIAASVAAIFVAIFALALLAWPGRRVSKRRLGIERERLNLGKSIDAFLERRGRRRGLAQALALADIDIEPGQFVLRVLVVSVVLAILGLLVSPVLGLILLVVPYFVARSWVSYKAGKRQERFAEQFPDFLRSLVMSLRSGYGLIQAIEMAVTEARDPLREELDRVLTEARLGRSVSEAMHGLADRMDNDDLEWVIGAIDINRETGGNLSDILATVNATIRERGRIQRKVKSLTAEGLFSAKILTAVPFLFALWQWRAHPAGFSVLFHGAGLLVLGACAGLMTLGWFWIKRTITVKI